LSEMKRIWVKAFALSFLVILMGQLAHAYNYNIYFIQQDAFANVQFRSPFRDPFARVTSPFNTPRDIGTCPHVGIDFSASVRTPVYSLLKIDEQHPMWVKEDVLKPVDFQWHRITRSCSL
jgi:hypothetical protein